MLGSLLIYQKLSGPSTPVTSNLSYKLDKLMQRYHQNQVHKTCQQSIEFSTVGIVVPICKQYAYHEKDSLNTQSPSAELTTNIFDPHAIIENVRSKLITMRQVNGQPGGSQKCGSWRDVEESQPDELIMLQSTRLIGLRHKQRSSSVMKGLRARQES